MELLNDKLTELNAPDYIMEWYQTHNLEGADFDKILNTGPSKDILTWLQLSYGLTPKETEALYDYLNVHNSKYVINSDQVYDSQVVRASHEVVNSNLVISCENVNNSSSVNSSEDVYNSTYIYSSSFINNCMNCFRLNNGTGAAFVIDSVYINNSSYIIDSNNVINSKNCYNCFNINDCYYCANCRNLKSGIFCWDYSGEYAIFNQEITKEQFEIIKQQLNTIMSSEAIYIGDNWPEGEVGNAQPTRNYTGRAYYSKVSDKFWRWICTLPYFNAHIAYAITFHNFS